MTNRFPNSLGGLGCIIIVHRRRRGGGNLPPPLGPPPPPPPPLPMVEADSQHFCFGAFGAKRIYASRFLACLWRGPQGDPGRRGVPAKPPSPPSPPPLIHFPWDVGVAGPGPETPTRPPSPRGCRGSGDPSRPRLALSLGLWPEKRFCSARGMDASKLVVHHFAVLWPATLTSEGPGVKSQSTPGAPHPPPPSSPLHWPRAWTQGHPRPPKPISTPTPKTMSHHHGRGGVWTPTALELPKHPPSPRPVGRTLSTSLCQAHTIPGIGHHFAKWEHVRAGGGGGGQKAKSQQRCQWWCRSLTAGGADRPPATAWSLGLRCKGRGGGGGMARKPICPTPPPPPWPPCREGGFGPGCPTCRAGGGGGASTPNICGSK